MTPDLHITRSTFSALSAQDLAGWRALMADDPQTQRAFLSPDFCAAAETAYARPVTVVLVRQRADGRLVGVLPVQARASLVGTLGVYEPVAGVMNDYFGLLASAGLRVSAEQLLSRSGIGCIDFSHLDETQAAHGLHGEDPRIGLRTRIHGTGDAHWEALRLIDKKLVSDTERRERKLIAEHGALTFAFHSASPRGALEQLITLKQDQYQRTGRALAPLFDVHHTRLLHALLELREPLCTGVLSTLHAGDQLVAAHFGLQSGAMLHFWFPVYVDQYAAYSPGRILYRHIIRDAHLHGVQVIDRGEGDSKAKRDFANEEHLFYKGVWTGGLRGVVAKAALSAHWRLQRRAQVAA
jgi:CelD/BcsL family acetyltransferase involved in cellulose biosynthesis